MRENVCKGREEGRGGEHNLMFCTRYRSMLTTLPVREASRFHCRDSTNLKVT